MVAAHRPHQAHNCFSPPTTTWVRSKPKRLRLIFVRPC
jgi:hypothetical protein